jgi:DNA-binding IclR family transcriptional regulator
MVSEDKTAYSVPSARHAGRIILHLSQHPNGQRLVDVARELGINVSTCHNILRTLCDLGVLARDEQGKAFRIGLNLIDAISDVIARGDPLALMKPLLQSLGERTRMTAILGEVSSPTTIRILTSVVPQGSIALQVSGGEVPILSGAMGQVVAAWGGLNLEELRARFDEAPRQREQRFADFLVRVADVPAIGWAVDEGVYHRGIWGIAAPVPTNRALVDKILCLATAADTLPRQRVREVGEMLVRAARQMASGAQ